MLACLKGAEQAIPGVNEYPLTENGSDVDFDSVVCEAEYNFIAYSSIGSKYAELFLSQWGMRLQIEDVLPYCKS